MPLYLFMVAPRRAHGCVRLPVGWSTVRCLQMHTPPRHPWVAPPPAQADVDELFTLKNHFYVGNFQVGCPVQSPVCSVCGSPEGVSLAFEPLLATLQPLVVFRSWSPCIVTPLAWAGPRAVCPPLLPHALVAFMNVLFMVYVGVTLAVAWGRRCGTGLGWLESHGVFFKRGGWACILVV